MKPEAAAQWHPVARIGEVRPGDVIAIAIGDRQLVLGLDGDRYFVTQRQCAHRNADLADGIVARGHLICPLHGYRFSTLTGRAPSVPGGASQPASEYCLATYAVRVVGDQIEVDPRPQPRSTE